MQARDLDRIYTGNTFGVRAEEMILKDKLRIKKINVGPLDFKKISIGIISGGADAADISASLSFFFRARNTHPNPFSLFGDNPEKKG